METIDDLHQLIDEKIPAMPVNKIKASDTNEVLKEIATAQTPTFSNDQFDI